MKLGTASTFACVGGLLLAGGAKAADVYSPVTPEIRQVVTEQGRTFSVAPYFWAAGISGDVGQFGLPPVEVDASFGNIFDHLDFGAMAIGEARYDRFSIFGDIMYTKISGSTGTPRGILASSVEVSTETFAGLIGAGYALLEDISGRLEVVGGARVWSVDTDISFSGGILNGISRSDGASWADAVAGLRGNYAITPEIYLTGWGLVGAGGADIDWDVAGAVGYRFNDKISAVAGYRALGVDYSNDDGFVFDVVQQGPILGMVVRF
ncbi:hypothetical protein G6N74_28360 [Mesorhizobium sp. CGMCC 1.15528]|uniref:Porin family protein n=1 Tax=Mesorhizobium zhangyense TaxID=1776730 RepID=A0A7C9RBM0_9HYPH|nr:hypothetical protein [Mesorhizobium zhangyense]NGN44974.1 hypothetical protein [Mesorhizobium zhangyense]